jgi:hypothetical protein
MSNEQCSAISSDIQCQIGPVSIANTSGASEFTPVISGVRVTRSFVLCLCFVDRSL